jgi:hypothetical protein
LCIVIFKKINWINIRTNKIKYNNTSNKKR